MKKITVLTNIKWAPNYDRYLNILSYETKQIYVNKNNIETAERMGCRVATDEHGFSKQHMALCEFTTTSGAKYLTEDLWVIE